MVRRLPRRGMNCSKKADICETLLCSPRGPETRAGRGRVRTTQGVQISGPVLNAHSTTNHYPFLSVFLVHVKFYSTAPLPPPSTLVAPALSALSLFPTLSSCISTFLFQSPSTHLPSGVSLLSSTLSSPLNTHFTLPLLISSLSHSALCTSIVLGPRASLLPSSLCLSRLFSYPCLSLLNHVVRFLSKPPHPHPRPTFLLRASTSCYHIGVFLSRGADADMFLHSLVKTKRRGGRR